MKDTIIKPGYKKTPVGIIPEDWEVKKFIQIADFLNGRAYKKEELLNTGKYKVLRVGNFFTNNRWYFSNLELDDDKYVMKDDLMYAWSASFGPRIWEGGDKTIYHYHIWKVIPKENIKKLFLFYLLDFDTIRIANENKQGGTMFHITKKDMENRMGYIPPLPEQKSIASCLSTWDKGIDKLTQLIQAKKQQKKGLMQQLLTGKIRLHAETGEKFEGEWREVRLGEISKKKSSTLQANNLVENSGNFPVYGATGFITKINFYDEDQPYIGIVKDGSGVGKIYLLEAKSSVLGTLDKISAKNNSNLYFLFSLLKMLNFEKYKVGGAIPHIYYKDYSNQKILIPSLEEQTAIAEVLQTADKEIELLERKLEAFKEQKRGLMQVLLTGERRLITIN